LDDAVRRRFVKRLYIPLPNIDGRAQLIKSLTDNNAFHLLNEDIKALAIKTKGFSGADLYNLCS
jgi:SpoVK/Ycf46/Vps4 family AAA+-type ATPase